MRSPRGLNFRGSFLVTAAALAETMRLSRWWRSKRLVGFSRKDRGEARWSGREAMKISRNRISTRKITQSTTRSHVFTTLGSTPHFFKSMRGWWCLKCSSRNFGNSKIPTLLSMRVQDNSTVIQIMASNMKIENKLKRQSHSPRSLQGWRRPTRRLRSWRMMRSSKARILISRFKITCIIRKI